MGMGVTLAPNTFYHAFEDIYPRFPFSVYSKDSPFEAVCHDAHGAPIHMKVMAHDPVVAKTRIDKPEGEEVRRYITDYLGKKGRLHWFKVGAGRAWLITAKDMYASLEELVMQGITIYSTRKDLAKNSLCVP